MDIAYRGYKLNSPLEALVVFISFLIMVFGTQDGQALRGLEAVSVFIIICSTHVH
jgi:hypothetical protein